MRARKPPSGCSEDVKFLFPKDPNKNQASEGAPEMLCKSGFDQALARTQPLAAKHLEKNNVYSAWLNETKKASTLWKALSAVGSSLTSRQRTEN